MWWGLAIAAMQCGCKDGYVFSVNKMLGGLSNLGHGFCVGRTRVSREVWVADFALSGGGKWEGWNMCGFTLGVFLRL